MSGKKERMDAIERRLKRLEDHVLFPLADDQDDPPEFSCQPTRGPRVEHCGDTEPHPEHGYRGSPGYPGDPGEELSCCGTLRGFAPDSPIVDDEERWIRLGKTIGTAAVALGVFPPSEVRERVRERSDLADALAGVRDLYATDCDDADLLAKAAYEIVESRAKIGPDTTGDDLPLWGSSEHFQTLVTRIRRYEASMAALLKALEWDEFYRSAGSTQEAVAHLAGLVQSVLDGGVIVTREQPDE